MSLLQNMKINVFLIPGGEAASLSAYEQLVKLLEVHEDLFLSVYRGPNKHDGKWSLVLIGDKTSLSRYQAPITDVLSQVQAQPINVPSEGLAPLVERYLTRQTQMLMNEQTFVEHHHPLGKKHYVKKKKEASWSQRRKKRC
jgi:hypothetical protein